MPRKPTTTKDELIEAAFQLIRREGSSALNVRRLADDQFQNLKELTDLTYERADMFHTGYILSDDDFMEIGLRYIRFADEEPQLFRFLFQSGRFDGFNLIDLIRDNVDDSIIAAAARDMEMDQAKAVECFEILFAMVHGYASLVANNAIEYNEGSMRKILDTAAGGLMGAL